MVMPNTDPFWLSDYCRRLIGKAATRIGPYGVFAGPDGA